MRVLHDWLLTPARVAIHEPTDTAVVADLHLGYNEARRRSGEAVPLFDIGHHLRPLSRMMLAHKVHRLAIAGDLFEDGFDDSVLSDFISWLKDTGVEVAGVVPGNHDRNTASYAGRLPLFTEGLRLDRWHIVHGDKPIVDMPTVHGHLHPAIQRHGRRYPCYLVGSRRLVLPAYFQDARGVNIRNDSILRQLRSVIIVGGRLVEERLQIANCP
jgi:uncharacterized protein